MPQIYEQVGGLWVVQWDDGSRTTFATEAEAGMAERDQEFIAKVRGEVKALWDSINELRGHRKRWDALALGDTMADGTGPNAGVTAAHTGAVVHATLDALESLLAAGHATNLARLL